MHHREARITAAERNARPFLSVVIPAFNEERRLPPTLTRLHDYLHDRPYDWEVIVVSNGCTDATDEVVREAAKQIPNLHLIALAERGKGIATKTGALRSSGEIVFLCDADLSMPPENISAFLDRLETAEVIVGSREAPGSHRYGEPWHRHMMGRLFNSLVQFVAVRGIEDTQCGFKAFRRNAARDLFSRQTLIGFGFDVELLYLARKLGYRIQELGIPWYFDNDTRVRPGLDSVGMFYEVLMVRLRDAAGRYGRLAPAPEVEGDVV